MAAHEEEFQQMRENHNESKWTEYTCKSNYKKKVKTVMVTWTIPPISTK